MPVDPVTYLEEALDLIEQEAFNASGVDWTRVRAECRDLAASAQTPADTYPALRHALSALNDHHSHLRLPDAGTTHRGLLGVYYTRGTVAFVFPGSPAALADVRPGDRVRRVQGKSVGGAVNDGLPPDSVVTLEVERAGERRVLTLTRAEVPVVPPEPQGHLAAPGVGVVTLPDCDLSGLLADGTPYEEWVRALLRDLAAQGAACWVVDLRRNLGGNMWPMLAGIGPLAGEGELGAFVGAEERWAWRYERGAALLGEKVMRRVGGPAPDTLPDHAPVAVLTSPLTASSGEIVTLSFVGRSGTRLFGEATRGLTTSNSLYELPDGAALLLTTARDADRTGRVYSGPIQPDVVILTEWDEFQTPQDPVLNAALAWLADC
ncbi:S41 family peptidase [Deinococcus sp. MIMF12]|uniref:S41 family peptidase n=1 Tax=Deinococcus rhizophilus TaxID=3049544 RepID=A0ABT7JM01_9DEIO|nr:S41 family peptidase [Deinococcus rhizophilus]MDL2345515.1 S41 family peptidase [Deinococcus rhizophilus]